MECTLPLQIKMFPSVLIKDHKFFDVRSYHAELKSITLQEIEKALGKPTSVKGNGEDKIYVYKVNNQFELKFIIPKSTGKVKSYFRYFHLRIVLIKWQGRIIKKGCHKSRN